jgi:hypothetical protein
LIAPKPVLSSSPSGVWKSDALRPVTKPRQPKLLLAPSARSAVPNSPLTLSPYSSMPECMNDSRPTASGTSAGITLTTPPSASEPYSTLAGPRMTSTRSARRASIDGPSSSLHE